MSFGGSNLHTLAITGDYTQDADGALDMRLNNSAASDKLTVTGTATLDGTLSLTALTTLTTGQTWSLITATTIAGDFDTVDFPADGNPNWQNPGGNPYVVKN